MMAAYAVTIVLARLVGASGVGDYNLIVSYLNVGATIACLGLNTMVLRIYGEYNADSDYARHIKFFYFYLRKIIASSAILSIICTIIIYFGLFHFEFKLATTAILVLLVPFFAINLVNIEALRGLNMLNQSEFYRSLFRPLVILFSLAIVYIQDAQIEMLSLIFISVLFSFFLTSFKIKNIFSFNLKEFLKKNDNYSINESMPMMITSLSSILLIALPVFYLEMINGSEEVGLFSVALKISQFVSLTLVVINTVSAPKFAYLYSQGQKEKLQEYVKVVVRIISTVAFIIAITIFYYNRNLLAYLGDDFSTATPFILVLTVGQLVNSLTGSSGVLLNMVGGQRFVTKNIIIGVSLLCILLFFSPGLMSITLAYTGTTIVINLLNTRVLKKKYLLKSYLH